MIIDEVMPVTISQPKTLADGKFGVEVSADTGLLCRCIDAGVRVLMAEHQAGIA